MSFFFYLLILNGNGNNESVYIVNLPFMFLHFFEYLLVLMLRIWNSCTGTLIDEFGFGVEKGKTS